MDIETINTRRPRCAQCCCLGNMVWPNDPVKRKILYGYFIKNDFLGFVPEIRKITGCEIGEAKATYLHLAAQGQKCHWCGETLNSGNIVDCTKCNSVNLVWEIDNT